jgi:hypothetical protein
MASQVILTLVNQALDSKRQVNLSKLLRPLVFKWLLHKFDPNSNKDGSLANCRLVENIEMNNPKASMKISNTKLSKAISSKQTVGGISSRKALNWKWTLII